MSETLGLPGVALTNAQWRDFETLNTCYGPIRVRNTLVTKIEQLEVMSRILCSCPRIAYDSETSGLHVHLGAAIIGHALAVRSADYIAAWYVPVRHLDASMTQLRPDVAARAVSDVLNAPGVVGGHHMKFDQGMLRKDGVFVKGRQIIDTAIEATIANENEPAFGLKRLGSKYLLSGAADEKDEIEQWMKKDAQKLGLPYRKRRKSSDDDDDVDLDEELTYMEKYGHARVPIVLEGQYACRDVFLEALLMDYLEWTATTFPAVHTREHGTAQILHEMEWDGLPVDTDEIRRSQQRAIKEREVYRALVRAKIGADFDISDKNVRTLLFEKLKLTPPKLTKAGKRKQSDARKGRRDPVFTIDDYAVDKEVRDILAAKYPEHAEMINAISAEARANKIATTYTASFLQFWSPTTGCIHPVYNQMEQRAEGGVPVTGRLSSADPNVQNIASKPMHLVGCGCSKCVEGWKKGELVGPERKPGPEDILSIRRYFTVRPGYVRIYIDFSQIELRTLTWLCRDPNLLHCYANDLDVHAMTAKEVTGGDRKVAKEVNFGSSFGMTELGFAKRIPGYSKDPEGTRERAKVLLANFFAKYAYITRFRDWLANYMRANNSMFVSPFGRPRRIPEIASDKQWERERAMRRMMSSIVSGSAADLMKEVMIRARRWLAAYSPESRICQSIHDELVYELPVKDAVPLAQGIMQITTNWPTFESQGVPIRANMFSTTTTWEKKKEVRIDGSVFAYV